MDNATMMHSDMMETSEMTTMMATTEAPEEFANLEAIILFLRIFGAAMGIIGIFANTFVVLVVRRMGNHTSGSMFMILLAISDLCAGGYDSLFEAGLIPLLGYDPLAASDFICKSFTWFSWITTVSANLVVAGFCIDRVIAVYKPHVYRLKGKPKMAAIYCVVIYVLMGVYNLPVVSIFEANQEDEFCGNYNFSMFSEDFFANWLTVLNPGFKVIIPLTTIGVSNILIGWKLRKEGAKSEKNAARNNELSLQLMVMSIVLFILNANVSTFTRLSYYLEETSARDKTMGDLYMYVKLVCLITNNSVNFFSYVIMGKMFRTEFFKLLGCGGDSAGSK